jgi:hypothetical protein
LGGAALNIGPDADRNIANPNALPLAKQAAVIGRDNPVRINGKIHVEI